MGCDALPQSAVTVYGYMMYIPVRLAECPSTIHRILYIHDEAIEFYDLREHYRGAQAERDNDSDRDKK